MNIHKALAALQRGFSIKQPGLDKEILTLHKATVPILVTDDPMGQAHASWRVHQFVVNEINAPYAFSPEEMAATDWEVLKP